MPIPGSGSGGRVHKRVAAAPSPHWQSATEHLQGYSTGYSTGFVDIKAKVEFVLVYAPCTGRYIR